MAEYIEKWNEKLYGEYRCLGVCAQLTTILDDCEFKDMI